MARVEIKDEDLVVNMQGLRKLGTYKSEFTVPLSNIKSVAVNTEGWDEKPSISAARWGIGWLGFYMGGSYWENGFLKDGKVFCDIIRGEAAIVIELCETEDFAKIVIGVDNPEDVVKLIESALIRS